MWYAALCMVIAIVAFIFGRAFQLYKVGKTFKEVKESGRSLTALKIGNNTYILKIESVTNK